MTYFERANIRAMTGYVSGEQPEDEKVIKLNTNENPYPPSPAVAEALSVVSPDDLRRYPPPSALRFREIAASIHQVSPNHIIATRGGDELLRLVITTYVDPGEKIGTTLPSYSLYPVLAQIQDCPMVEVPYGDNWTLPDDFAARMNAADVKLTLLVNPHAPSGSMLNCNKISEIAGELKGLFLLDEAYIDFADTHYDIGELVNRHDNLIALRTLSKGYSLAGLRFGYGIADPDLIAPMAGKTRDSYNLDFISQRIAEVALRDQDHARSTWNQVKHGRARLKAALHELGLVSPPSEANFLLVTVPPAFGCDAESLYKHLKERHILVRYFDQPGLTDKLRITVGSTDENNQLVNAITEIHRLVS